MLTIGPKLRWCELALICVWRNKLKDRSNWKQDSIKFEVWGYVLCFLLPLVFNKDLMFFFSLPSSVPRLLPQPCPLEMETICIGHFQIQIFSLQGWFLCLSGVFWVWAQGLGPFEILGLDSFQWCVEEFECCPQVNEVLFSWRYKTSVTQIII